MLRMAMGFLGMFLVNVVACLKEPRIWRDIKLKIFRANSLLKVAGLRTLTDCSLWRAVISFPVLPCFKSRIHLGTAHDHGAPEQFHPLHPGFLFGEEHQQWIGLHLGFDHPTVWTHLCPLLAGQCCSPLHTGDCDVARTIQHHQKSLSSSVIGCRVMPPCQRGKYNHLLPSIRSTRRK